MSKTRIAWARDRFSIFHTHSVMHSEMFSKLIIYRNNIG